MGSKRAVPMLYLHLAIEPVKNIHVDFRSIMSWICSFMTWKNKACVVQPQLSKTLLSPSNIYLCAYVEGVAIDIVGVAIAEQRC